MALSLENLRDLAAVNPFKWEQLSSDEILNRCHAAGLNLPPYFNPIPTADHRSGIGKTVLTRSVLEYCDARDADLATLLREVINEAGNREGERLVFEVIETMAAYAARTALECVADAARDGAGEEVSARRVM